MSHWVYILASKPGGTLNVGVTSDLGRRIYELRNGLADGFTKRYDVKSLLYYEGHEAISTALRRDKNIKHWSREWKIGLIIGCNPDWRDLYEQFVR